MYCMPNSIMSVNILNICDRYLLRNLWWKFVSKIKLEINKVVILQEVEVGLGQKRIPTYNMCKVIVC